MSDFDKEAEREKLREKYGKEEEERREATEQMSELLLQGATMTNAHCSDCGDPIFRYDGTEFCPTCEKRVDRDTGGDAVDEDAAGGGDERGPADATGEGEPAADAESGDGTAPDPQTVEVTSPSDDATVKFGGPDPEESAADANAADGTVEENAVDANAERNAADVAASRPDTAETGGEPSADERTEPRADPTASGGAEDRPSGAADPTASGGTGGHAAREEHTAADRVPSLGPGSGEAEAAPTDRGAAGPVDVDAAASESLQRARRTLAATVERFSRRALETDNPREAREYLETAREAAATLEATEF